MAKFQPDTFITVVLSVVLLSCTKPADTSTTVLVETRHLEADTPVVTVPIKRSAHICSSSPILLDAQGIFDVNAISRLRFVTDDFLELEGWAPLPSPSKTEETTIEASDLATLPASDPHGQSHRVTLRIGEYDLQQREAKLLTQELNSLLHNPCAESCDVEILSQSPDAQWQLIQIMDAQTADEGVWIVSQSDKIKLLDFVPFWSAWQWAEDNTVLMYVSSTPIYGKLASVVQLSVPPIVSRFESGSTNPLDPTYYYLAFSPQEKTILSVAEQSRPDLTDKEKLYTFDLQQVPAQIISDQIITGIKKVEWNDATNSYLLVTTWEDGLEISDLGRNVVVRLPATGLEHIFGPVPEATIELNIPFTHHAVSASGKRLAVALGGGKVYIFDCLETALAP